MTFWGNDMTIKINGSDTEVDGALTIAGLLAKFSVDPTRAVVELNGSIVERARAAEVALAEGDRVEIVRFVGGG